MKTSKSKPWFLLITALGVVFGDIGTSPLYALKSSFIISELEVIDTNIIGLISLFVWVLFLVVTLKYIYVVMNIHKREEKGGVLALSALYTRMKRVRHKWLYTMFGIIGTAFLLGDGVITPAISVLSALEGINIISGGSQGYVIIASIVVLTALFALQRFGSKAIGAFLGPIMLLWFITLAVLGVYNIIVEPIILKALNPYFAIQFIASNGGVAFKSVSGIFLVITGAEALYADSSYFGNRPIQLSWNFLVFPALVLNYLGQGGLLIRSPELISDPFYHLVPPFGLFPLIILASCATIIASQAMISGVFAILWQAIKLGYVPNVKVIFTSPGKPEQVYIPIVNTILYILTIVAIIIFQTSSKLSFAYGLCVSGGMFITTILVFTLLVRQRNLRIIKLGVIVLMFFLDCIFVLANLIKIADGAWYALLITIIASLFMWMWIKRKGRRKRS